MNSGNHQQLKFQYYSVTFFFCCLLGSFFTAMRNAAFVFAFLWCLFSWRVLSADLNLAVEKCQKIKIENRQLQIVLTWIEGFYWNLLSCRNEQSFWCNLHDITSRVLNVTIRSVRNHVNKHFDNNPASYERGQHSQLGIHSFVFFVGILTWGSFSFW